MEITRFVAIQTSLKAPIQVDQAWLKLIDFARNHPYCKMELSFRDGSPHLAEVIKDSIKF